MRRALLLFFTTLAAMAQGFDLPASLEPSARAALARRVLEEGTASDEVGLHERLRLQIQAQDLDGALATAERLHAIQRGPLAPSRSRTLPLYELHARTLRAEAAGLASETALETAFTGMVKDLPDPAAYQVSWALRGDAAGAERDLQARWEKLKAKGAPLSREEAVALLLDSETRDAILRLLPRARALMAQEEERHYLIEEDVHIETAPGVTVCATLIRPRTEKRLPTAFEFTVYANEGNRSEALHSASEGFIGLVANSRGKRHSAAPVEPYEHDGADAAAVIDWIAAQPWSDGQVAMYGGSYDGFTQWAAAKRHPKALKAIMPCVPVAPGIDMPMQNGVFQNFTYRWLPYVTNTKLLDEAGYNDWNHWNGLDWAWFGQGRPYRDLPEMDGKPNPLFLRWLDHPTYDAYWQAMIPYGQEFVAIDLPVLTVSGYFDGCLLSATYYFRQHTGRRKGAEHYLVLGPYGHISGQRRSQEVEQGYRLEPAAALDVEVLRYQWLHHVLRGGPRPAFLKDRVNVQVMGADAWRHAPSLEALASSTRTFHLSSAKEGVDHRLDPASKGKTPLALKVDFAERETPSFGQPSTMDDTELDRTNSLVFATAPLWAPLELDGCFEGSLALTLNKRDVDLALQLYEQKADGRYLLLSYHIFRASLLRDRTHRQLLRPGRETLLPFRSGRPVARRVGKGSRLLFLVTVLKEPRLQVNYGTGKDVSVESMKDAGEPLTLRLGPGSRLVMPVNE